MQTRPRAGEARRGKEDVVSEELRFVRPEEAEPTRAGASRMFTGDTQIREVSTALGLPYIEVNALFVEPGARSRPHRHEVEQLLYFLKGPGVVAIDGGEDRMVPEGAFVVIPAGAVHKHGAPADNAAAYISFIAMQHESDFDVELPAAWRDYADR